MWSLICDSESSFQKLLFLFTTAMDIFDSPFHIRTLFLTAFLNLPF